MHQIGRLGLGALLAASVLGCGLPAERSEPPAATPVEVAVGGDPWPDLDWRDTAVEPEDGGNVRMVAVAAGAGGFVAIGHDDDELLDTIVLTSRDAVEWIREDLSVPGVELSDVVATGDGYVAIGSAEPGQGIAAQGVAVTSHDGRTWRAVEDLTPFADAYILSVAWGPGGLIATGADENGEPVMWRSADGAAWQRVAAADLGAGDLMIESIGSGPNGWLAPGRTDDRAFVIASADGITWSAAQLAPSRRAPDLLPVATKAVDGPFGRLVLGMEAQRCGFLWWEGDCGGWPAAWWADGTGEWVSLPVAGTPMEQWPVVIAGGRGFIAATGLGVFASIDGQVWSELVAVDPEAAVTPNDVVEAGDRLVVVGERTRLNGSMTGLISVGAPPGQGP